MKDPSLLNVPKNMKMPVVRTRSLFDEIKDGDLHWPALLSWHSDLRRVDVVVVVNPRVPLAERKTTTVPGYLVRQVIAAAVKHLSTNPLRPF